MCSKVHEFQKARSGQAAVGGEGFAKVPLPPLPGGAGCGQEAACAGSDTLPSPRSCSLALLPSHLSAQALSSVMLAQSSLTRTCLPGAATPAVSCHH